MRFAARGATGRALGAALVAGALGAGVLSTASADDVHGDANIPGTPVTVSAAACGGGWDGGAAGPQTFALFNPGMIPVEVELQDVASKKVFFDVEDLGAGATRETHVSLAPGTYRFLCLYVEQPSTAGAHVQVTGSYDGPVTPGTVPTTDLDLLHAELAYQKWVSGRIPVVQARVNSLAAALRKGRLTRARNAWSAGLRTYLTLGAAYDAFGDFGDQIDPTPSTQISAYRDKELTGFPRIEALLWHGTPTKRAMKRRILPVAKALQKSLAGLVGWFGHPTTVSTLDLGLRSHEILEDALQFDLTGRTDAGAHRTLADIDAEIAGTRQVMGTIRPLLAQRLSDLATVDAWLDRLKTLVESYHNPKTNTWTPLQSLTTSQREKVNATLSQTVEYLSQVAVVTDPTLGVPQ